MRKLVTLSVDSDNVVNLKNKGISLSKFFDQAYNALKNKLWKYEHNPDSKSTEIKN